MPMLLVATHRCENLGPVSFQGFSAGGVTPDETSYNPWVVRRMRVLNSGSHPALLVRFGNLVFLGRRFKVAHDGLYLGAEVSITQSLEFERKESTAKPRFCRVAFLDAP